MHPRSVMLVQHKLHSIRKITRSWPHSWPNEMISAAKSMEANVKIYSFISCSLNFSIIFRNVPCKNVETYCMLINPLVCTYFEGKSPEAKGWYLQIYWHYEVVRIACPSKITSRNPAIPSALHIPVPRDPYQRADKATRNVFIFNFPQHSPLEVCWAGHPPVAWIRKFSVGCAEGDRKLTHCELPICYF